MLVKRLKELSNKTRSCPRKSPFRARTPVMRSSRGVSKTTKLASSKIPTALTQPKMLELQHPSHSRRLDLNQLGPGNSVEVDSLQTLMVLFTCERSAKRVKRNRNRRLSLSLLASRMLTARKSPLRLRFSLRRSKGALRSPRCAKSSRKSGTILHNLRLP